MTAHAHNLIITPESVQTAGSVSYWRLTGTIALDVLAAAWRAAGLDEKMLPKPPGDEVAFGRAVRDQTTRHRLVRRLKTGAWLVVDEVPAADGSTATYDVIASMAQKDGALQFDHVGGSGSVSEFIALRDRVYAAFGKHRGQLEADDISSWLVKTANQLRAVALRDTGGIYFIPHNQVWAWNQVVNAVRSVSSHQVFSIPAMKNSDAIAAITAAISEEAEQVVARMYEDLQGTGDAALGTRALKTREKEAAALLAKVDEYEQLIESRLAARQRVEELQAALATAALMAAAD